MGPAVRVPGGVLVAKEPEHPQSVGRLLRRHPQVDSEPMDCTDVPVPMPVPFKFWAFSISETTAIVYAIVYACVVSPPSLFLCLPAFRAYLLLVTPRVRLPGRPPDPSLSLSPYVVPRICSVVVPRCFSGYFSLEFDARTQALTTLCSATSSFRVDFICMRAGA